MSDTAGHEANSQSPTAADRPWQETVNRRLRRAAGDGTPLPPVLRGRLERALGADLGALRLHTDTHADELARHLDADAATAGADVFFRAGAFNPGTAEGLALVAHEAAHAVQQAAGAVAATAAVTISRPGDAAERAADAAAARVLHGLPAQRAAAPVRVRPLADRQPLMVQRHASFEHRLLGDALAADLNSVALGQPSRTQLLTDLVGFLGMWLTNPKNVTKEQIEQKYPYIRTLTLRQSGLLVTYGELNTLPDYMASPAVLDQQPESIMLPILQAVRQEGYNRIQRMIGGQEVSSFQDSVAINTGWDFIDLLLETKAIDTLTANIGPANTNHYGALVGRNACHFAPFSWYRWEQHYLLAVDAATKAFAATDAGERERLTYLAWMNHGYADHFLHDSFAAGHLINKTLIMQWFVEWAAGRPDVPVVDWDKVKNLATAQQGGIWARDLYTPLTPGIVRDPQTAEEQATIQGRINLSGVQRDRTIDATQTAAYMNYLAFLNNTTVQSASGVLHDNFNAQSVWAASVANNTPFQLYGDDTMLNGGDGVRIASETAHMSQQSILDLLGSGSTSITAQSLRDRFPALVRNDAGKLVALHDWNLGLKQLTFDLFPDVHYYALRAIAPNIDNVSVDLPGFAVWRDALATFAADDHAGDVAVGANGAAFALRPGADPAGGGGGIYALTTDSGAAPSPLDMTPLKKTDVSAGFTGTAGAAIAVAPDGTPWALNSDGVIQRRVGVAWQTVASDGASDIGIGKDGTVWITDRTDAGNGNHGIRRWNGSGWDAVDGGAVRISVGPDGIPWAVNAAGAILHRVGTAPLGSDWDTLPGEATDIGVGGNGAVWITGRNSVGNGDMGVYHWSDRDYEWVPVDGGGQRVAVDADGVPWLVTAAGKIERWNLGESPAQALDVVVVPDLGPSDLLPPDDDPFVLTRPQFIAVQTYVDAGTMLPSTAVAMQAKLGIFSEDVNQFGDLIGGYKSISDHCAYFKTVTFPLSVSLASDIVAYNLKVPVYYGGINIAISQWRDGTLPPDVAQAKFKLILGNLRAAAKGYADNAATVKAKMQDFFEQTQADRVNLYTLKDHYRQRYEGRQGEIAQFMDQIKNDSDSIKLWNAEYEHDVIVAATTPTYAWVFPIGTIAAVVVAGVYGARATAALDQVHQYQQKLEQAEAGLRQALLVMHDIELADSSMDGILTSLNAALPVIAKIEGIWSLIANSLTALIDQIIDKDIDQAELALKSFGVQKAINQWAAVAQIANDYRLTAYITVTSEEDIKKGQAA